MHFQMAIVNAKTPRRQASIGVLNNDKEKKMAGNTGMEKLIPVINEVQDIFTKFGVNLNFDLPQIAVVGGQSAGKSSVLENFVGKDFLPRGAGIVTRRPLILQLITNTTSEEEYAEFSHTGTKRFAINEVCKEIEDETDRSTDGNKGISPLPINLRIYSPKVLNLTLVDLPGLTKVPIDDQPWDIEEQIRKMILEFISKDNCLILAVTPANSDLANSDALKLAKEVDPAGTRTIGVVTKLDLMDKGTDARDILENKVYPLLRGYVGIRNRGQHDIEQKKEIADAMESEREFFLNHDAYKHIAHRHGTPYLQRTLNKQLTNHIGLTLPSLRDDLYKRLAKIKEDLGDEDYGLDDEGAKIKSITDMHSKLQDQFYNEIGFYESDEVGTTLNGGSKICAEMHEKFPAQIADVTLKNDELRKEIVTTIRNLRGARKGLFIPDKAFENVTKAQISRLKDPSIKCVRAVVKELTTILNFCIGNITKYPKLRDETEKILMHHVKECEEKCKEQLDIAIKVELGYLNTEHDDFVKPDSAQKTAESSVPRPSAISNGLWIEPTNEQLEEWKMEKEAEKFKIMIDSYLKIVTKSVHDLVPKTIMYFVIENMKKFIKSTLIVKLFISNNGSPLTELSEDEQQRREKLKSMRDATEQALEKIDEVSSTISASK